MQRLDMPRFLIEEQEFKLGFYIWVWQSFEEDYNEFPWRALARVRKIVHGPSVVADATDRVFEINTDFLPYATTMVYP